MRFSINKSELLNALTIVSKGTASRSTIPALSGVYIKAEGMGLVMEATDLERSYSLQRILLSLKKREQPLFPRSFFWIS